MRNVGLFECIGERLQGRAGYNDGYELINILGQVCSDITTAETTGNGEASRHVSGLYPRAFQTHLARAVVGFQPTLD